jgi:hypothetical protein
LYWWVTAGLRMARCGAEIYASAALTVAVGCCCLRSVRQYDIVSLITTSLQQQRVYQQVVFASLLHGVSEVSGWEMQL